MKQFIAFLLGFSATFTSFGQAEWSELPNAPSFGGRIDDIYFLDGETGWAAGGNGTVYKTEDGGNSWEVQYTDSGNYFRNIEFIDENIGFLGTLNDGFLRTTDGGSTWEPVFISPQPEAICGIDVVDNLVYACGAWFMPAHVIKSTDGGLSFQFIDMSPYATGLVEIIFINENLGFVSGGDSNGGVILKTEDGGDTWFQIYNSNLSGDYVWKMQLLDNNTIYASIQSNGQGKLIKSFDGGQNWEEKNFPDPAVQAVGFINEEHGWMGGINSGFYETTDGGDTWTNMNLGFDLNRFIIFNDQFGYASGETIYKYGDELSITDPSNSNVSNSNLSVTITPVPVSEKLMITIEFDRPDNLLLTLYDIQGRFLKNLTRDRIYDNGVTKEYIFDFDYPTGTYVLDIHNNSGRHSKQFIKE